MKNYDGIYIRKTENYLNNILECLFTREYSKKASAKNIYIKVASAHISAICYVGVLKLAQKYYSGKSGTYC